MGNNSECFSLVDFVDILHLLLLVDYFCLILSCSNINTNYVEQLSYKMVAKVSFDKQYYKRAIFDNNIMKIEFKLFNITDV